VAKKKQFKAFKIHHPFNSASGKRYRRTEYLQATSKGQEDELRKAQFAQELDAGTKAPPAAPAAPAAAPKPAVDPNAPVSPDWSFQTIKQMREWLDASGVVLCGPRSTKATHEKLCAAAWASGSKPNPLYGYPGGPVPSPGFSALTEPGAAGLAAAIDAAKAAGFSVEAALAELEALSTADATPTPEPEPQDTGEGTKEPAGAPETEETTGTPESANETPGEAPATPCEGCDDGTPATTEDSEGTPLCGECYAFLVTDADADGLPTTVLPEGETEYPVKSDATADTPATREE
jgi:hypothetical protein